MAARNKPYDQFGPFILFKKLEADSLGDLWRAGRIEKGQLGPTVALRRLSGGHREMVSANVQAVAQVLPRISGTSFVRDQQAGVIENVPYLSWEYGGGRSLRHIINCARGGKDTHPNPLPIDQALVIAEKIALSTTTMADLRDTNGTRLSHGALIPQFIWISDDGEIRVGGQQLGSAMIASLHDPNVAADIGRYFSPEHRAGQPQRNADVYSLGAILFLLVTGQEPPDAMTASAFLPAVRAAKTMAGAAIPDDIRVILDKSFNLDPSMRYQSMADMKQAISALATGGKYSATTFNLAFYLSNLLKKEMETEAADREKESAVNVTAYLEAPKAAPAPASAPVPVAAAPAAPAPAMFAAQAQPKAKSKAPMAIAATVLVAVVGAGAFMMLGKAKTQPPATQVATAQLLPKAAAAPQPIISEPIAVSANPQTTTATPATATSDAAAQQAAFEAAVRQKLQAEMMKLQNDFLADLKKQQSKNAPVVSAPAAAAPQTAAAEEERPTMSAAQMTAERLDQQRREQAAVEQPRATVPAPVQNTQTSAPAPAIAQPAAPSQPQVAQVREGDVVDIATLDVVPRISRATKPLYPPLAMRQKVAATIFLTVLIDEGGEVRDVRVLRGDSRFGFNDAAMRAMRATRFTSPMKNGKRVKTWFPQSIEFKP